MDLSADYQEIANEERIALEFQKPKTQYDNETEPIIKNSERLSIFQKLCFAVGGLPYQMCGNALGLFLPAFLLEIAQLRPKQVSIVLFSARGWDAVTDPLIGFFVNKTNTRFGKLRPWILFFAPFSVLSYIMIWYVPNMERSLKTFWYLIFYCLFQTFLSCLHVPYTSLTMYLTPSQKERDSATSYRMAFEIFGVLLAALIQGIMISIYGAKFSCDTTTTAIMTTSSLNKTEIFYDSNQFKFKSKSSETSGYSKLGEGYLISAGTMSFIYLLCCCITFFGTKEMHDVIIDKDTKFFGSIKKIFSHKSYVILLLTFMFNSLAVQLVQANLALYCKYAIDASDQYQIIIIVLLISTILSLPLWQFLSNKCGKKTTYAFGLILFIPNLFVLLFIEKPIWVVYIIGIIAGFSISVNFLLPWSMLPDVIDEFMIKTGERKESIFYSFYVFFNKLASGLAVAVSTLILEFGGYIDCPNGCCTQPKSVGLTLRLLVVPAPVIFLLISLILLWKHPIDEKKRKEIKETLNTLRQTKNNQKDSLY